MVSSSAFELGIDFAPRVTLDARLGIVYVADSAPHPCCPRHPFVVGAESAVPGTSPLLRLTLDWNPAARTRLTACLLPLVVVVSQHTIASVCAFFTLPEGLSFAAVGERLKSWAALLISAQEDQMVQSILLSLGQGVSSAAQNLQRLDISLLCQKLLLVVPLQNSATYCTSSITSLQAMSSSSSQSSPDTRQQQQEKTSASPSAKFLFKAASLDVNYCTDSGDGSAGHATRTTSLLDPTAASVKLVFLESDKPEVKVTAHLGRVGVLAPVALVPDVMHAFEPVATAVVALILASRAPVQPQHDQTYIGAALIKAQRRSEKPVVRVACECECVSVVVVPSIGAPVLASVAIPRVNVKAKALCPSPKVNVSSCEPLSLTLLPAQQSNPVQIGPYKVSVKLQENKTSVAIAPGTCRVTQDLGALLQCVQQVQSLVKTTMDAVPEYVKNLAHSDSSSGAKTVSLSFADVSVVAALNVDSMQAVVTISNVSSDVVLCDNSHSSQELQSLNASVPSVGVAFDGKQLLSLSQTTAKIHDSCCLTSDGITLDVDVFPLMFSFIHHAMTQVLSSNISQDPSLPNVQEDTEATPAEQFSIPVKQYSLSIKNIQLVSKLLHFLIEIPSVTLEPCDSWTSLAKVTDLSISTFKDETTNLCHLLNPFSVDFKFSVESLPFTTTRFRTQLNTTKMVFSCQAEQIAPVVQFFEELVSDIFWVKRLTPIPRLIARVTVKCAEIVLEGRARNGNVCACISIPNPNVVVFDMPGKTDVSLSVGAILLLDNLDERATTEYNQTSLTFSSCSSAQSRDLLQVNCGDIVISPFTPVRLLDLVTWILSCVNSITSLPVPEHSNEVFCDAPPPPDVKLVLPVLMVPFVDQDSSCSFQLSQVQLSMVQDELCVLVPTINLLLENAGTKQSVVNITGVTVQGHLPVMSINLDSLDCVIDEPVLAFVLDWMKHFVPLFVQKQPVAVLSRPSIPALSCHLKRGCFKCFDSFRIVLDSARILTESEQSGLSLSLSRLSIIDRVQSDESTCLLELPSLSMRASLGNEQTTVEFPDVVIKFTDEQILALLHVTNDVCQKMANLEQSVMTFSCSFKQHNKDVPISPTIPVTLILPSLSVIWSERVALVVSSVQVDLNNGCVRAGVDSICLNSCLPAAVFSPQSENPLVDVHGIKIDFVQGEMKVDVGNTSVFIPIEFVIGFIDVVSPRYEEVHALLTGENGLIQTVSSLKLIPKEEFQPLKISLSFETFDVCVSSRPASSSQSKQVYVKLKTSVPMIVSFDFLQPTKQAFNLSVPCLELSLRTPAFSLDAATLKMTSGRCSGIVGDVWSIDGGIESVAIRVRLSSILSLVQTFGIIASDLSNAFVGFGNKHNKESLQQINSHAPHPIQEPMEMHEFHEEESVAFKLQQYVSSLLSKHQPDNESAISVNSVSVAVDLATSQLSPSASSVLSVGLRSTALECSQNGIKCGTRVNANCKLGKTNLEIIRPFQVNATATHVGALPLVPQLSVDDPIVVTCSTSLLRLLISLVVNSRADLVAPSLVEQPSVPVPATLVRHGSLVVFNETPFSQLHVSRTPERKFIFSLSGMCPSEPVALNGHRTAIFLVPEADPAQQNKLWLIVCHPRDNPNHVWVSLPVRIQNSTPFALAVNSGSVSVVVPRSKCRSLPLGEARVGFTFCDNSSSALSASRCLDVLPGQLVQHHSEWLPSTEHSGSRHLDVNTLVADTRQILCHSTGEMVPTFHVTFLSPLRLANTLAFPLEVEVLPPSGEARETFVLNPGTSDGLWDIPSGSRVRLRPQGASEWSHETAVSFDWNKAGGNATAVLRAEPFALKFTYARSNEPLALVVSCALLFENRTDLDLEVDAQVFRSPGSPTAVLLPREGTDSQAFLRFRLAAGEWSEPRSVSSHGFSPVTVPGPAGAGSTVLVTVRSAPGSEETSLVVVEPLFLLRNASSTPIEVDQPAAAGARAQPRTVAPGASVGVHVAAGSEEPLVRVRVQQRRWSEPFSLQAQHAQYLRLRAEEEPEDDEHARPDAFCLLTVHASVMQTVWTFHGDDGSAPFLIRNCTSAVLEYAQEGSSGAEDMEHLAPHCEAHFAWRRPTGPKRLVVLGHAVDITRPDRVAHFRHGTRALSCVAEPRRSCWVVTVRECPVPEKEEGEEEEGAVYVVHEPPVCVRAMTVYAAQPSRVEFVARLRGLTVALEHDAATDPRARFALHLRPTSGAPAAVEARAGLSDTAVCASLAIADLAVVGPSEAPLLARWHGCTAATAMGEEFCGTDADADALLRVDACVLRREATGGALVLPRATATLAPLDLRIHAEALEAALALAEDLTPLFAALSMPPNSDDIDSSGDSDGKKRQNHGKRRREPRVMEPVHVGELAVAPVALRVCFTPYTVGAIVARHRSAVQLAARLVGAVPGGVIALAPRPLVCAELRGGASAVLAHLRGQCLWPLVQQTLAVLTDGKLSWFVARLARLLLPSGGEEDDDEEDYSVRV